MAYGNGARMLSMTMTKMKGRVVLHKGGALEMNGKGRK